MEIDRSDAKMVRDKFYQIAALVVDKKHWSGFVFRHDIGVFLLDEPLYQSYRKQIYYRMLRTTVIIELLKKIDEAYKMPKEVKE